VETIAYYYLQIKFSKFPGILMMQIKIV